MLCKILRFKDPFVISSKEEYLNFQFYFLSYKEKYS